MPTIYSRLKRAAAPVVKHYLTDISEHDRAACRKFRTGNTAIWAPREHGSFFIWVNGPGPASVDAEELKQLRDALNWFDAYQKQHPGLQWHLLESTDGQNGHCEPCSPEFARGLLTRRIDAIQRLLAESAVTAYVVEHGEAYDPMGDFNYVGSRHHY